MFTGIIQAKGEIRQIVPAPKYSLQIECKEICKELNFGDSIAVDGVCLSAVQIEQEFFEVELSEETLHKTTFLARPKERPVNLELPIRLSDRLGGHLVQGHVDTTVSLTRIKTLGEFSDLFFSVPPEQKQYLIMKGSVTLNGVSLTVSHLSEKEFGVSLIPITLQKTNLKDLAPGDSVNFEADLTAKYLESFVKHNPEQYLR